MTNPSPDVRRELEQLIEQDQSRLGQVYRLTEQGLTPPQIAAELGVGSSGFVSNYRTVARALLDGVLPAGPSMAHDVARKVGVLTRRSGVSPAAKAYLDDLLAGATEVASERAQRSSARARNRYRQSTVPAQTGESLRTLVDAQLRDRSAALVDHIGTEVAVDADDYLVVASSGFALDALTRLIMTLATSRTTKELHAKRRLDLSIEQAVIDWADDLPLATDLVDAARGRLDYWRSE